MFYFTIIGNYLSFVCVCLSILLIVYTVLSFPEKALLECVCKLIPVYDCNLISCLEYKGFCWLYFFCVTARAGFVRNISFGKVRFLVSIRIVVIRIETIWSPVTAIFVRFMKSFFFCKTGSELSSLSMSSVSSILSFLFPLLTGSELLEASSLVD